ncbi:MAG TPA: MFS transporter [Acidobacteriota bacterium]|nr:MFS transporter [Acidobacteriota bacterium]
MKRIRAQLLFFVAVKAVLNTMYRMIYPFLPVFARGLGVDIRTMSLALSVRSASGALGPLLAPLSDRKGRAFGMALGVGLFTAGAAAAFFGRGLALFVAALVLTTIGKYVFDPAMQAHLGDLVPFGRRGTALALTEWGWSFAFIFGVPAAGFLIVRFGWRSPFLVLALMGLASLAVLRLFFFGGNGREERPSEPAAGSAGFAGHVEKYGAVFRSAAARTALAVIFLGSMANETVNVVFGVWLEDSFGLKIAALGAASAVIGLSELGGETLVAGTIDRIGKMRALLLGFGANAVVSLLLPLGGRSTGTALVALFAFYLTFEFAVVSIIPLMSEILPGARATLLAFYTAAFSLGRAAGSGISPLLYRAGFRTVAFAAVALDVLVLLGLFRLRKLFRSAGRTP